MMMRAHRPQAAFTLIELLIVIGLITLLMAVLVPNLLTPQKQGQQAETLQRLKHLELCIRAFETKHGYYPPSTFANADKDVKVKNNGINEGIECLLVHIHKQSLGGTATLEDKVDWLENTDKDDGGYHIQLLETTKLLEVMDSWQQPIVYFREDAYGQPQTVALGGEDQEQATVRAMKNPATGRFLSPRKWQLISAGPDGEFGTDDDISIPPKPRND
jgi:prepilin-type N-terminal cleavage/methylation domain-containing protein